jgi:hypothetical protein
MFRVGIAHVFFLKNMIIYFAFWKWEVIIVQYKFQN